jgi:undecaprenyl diphosphate synthase
VSRHAPAIEPEQAAASAAAAALPRYVAIVSDGSARWAEARGLSIGDGHEAAANTVLGRISDSCELGIQELTLYAFSTENWTRPREEIDELLAMLARRIAADTPRLHDLGVRIQFIGRRDRGGHELARQMELAEALTRENCVMTVYVAFDYGARDEILRAARLFRGGGEAEFRALLGTPGMHDPDLVIRTSGEQRLSNFLLWQAAYSELVFREELWPDFGRRALEGSLATYSYRNRRYGGRAGAHCADAAVTQRSVAAEPGSSSSRSRRDPAAVRRHALVVPRALSDG